jgi:hypothetical protein
MAKNQNDVLAALLAVDDKLEQDITMKRFGVDFTIKALDGALINSIQNQATFFQGKGKNREKILDEQKFQSLIIEKGCVNPNWNAKELKERYPECPTTADIIQKRLLAGELARLTNEILDLSGFYDEEDEIKN